MTQPTFAEFESRGRAAGFDEVIVREWPAQAVLATHSHGFDIDALVVRGEMWLGCNGQVQHLQAGDAFTLARDLPHDERYGLDGATVWVARRRAARSA